MSKIADLTAKLARARALYVRDMTRRDRDALSTAEYMVRKWSTRTGANAKAAVTRWSSGVRLEQKRLDVATEQAGNAFDEAVEGMA